MDTWMWPTLLGGLTMTCGAWYTLREWKREAVIKNENEFEKDRYFMGGEE